MGTVMIEYMCRYCGQRIRKSSTQGRPNPGACPKKGKTRDGRTQPHTWIINRKFT